MRSFSISPSLDPSLLSLFCKNGLQSCVAWEGETRGKQTRSISLSHSTSVSSALWAGPSRAYRYQGSRQANRWSPNRRPPGSTAGSWGTGSLDLLTTLVTCHTGIAGTKFWVQGPGSSPLASSSFPPPRCRIYLFI